MKVLRINFQDPKAPQQFLSSIYDTGFAVIHNHDVEIDLIKRNYRDWKGFFDSETKFEYPLNKEQQTGYVSYRTEHSIYEKELKNLSEFYNYYPTGIVPTWLSKQTLDMHTALTNAGRKLLSWLDKTLPIQVTKHFSLPLEKMIDNSSNHLLRIIHYPKLEKKIVPGEIRTTRHEDSDLITLLPCPTEPGLQIEMGNNQWKDIVYNDKDIVINIGAQLQLITQNYLKSTMHRVINPDVKSSQNVARMSMPLFMHPRDEVLLTNTITAKQFLHEYLMQNGVK